MSEDVICWGEDTVLRPIYQGIFEKSLWYSVVFGEQKCLNWCFFHKDCELDRDNVAILKQLALGQQDAVFLTSCLVTGREIRRDRSYIFYVISDLLFGILDRCLCCLFSLSHDKSIILSTFFLNNQWVLPWFTNCFNVSTSGLLKNHRRYKHMRMSSALKCAVLIATKIRF